MPRQSSRRNKFTSRKPGPFLPGKLAQSQSLQRQYVVRRGCRAQHVARMANGPNGPNGPNGSSSSFSSSFSGDRERDRDRPDRPDRPDKGPGRAAAANSEPLDMAYEFLDPFPSLAQDSDLQRMKEDAESRSIDSKEEVSREMCRMLVDKAQNWQKTIAHVSRELPGDLDNLNPLSFLKPLTHYSVAGVVEDMSALKPGGGSANAGGGAENTTAVGGSPESPMSYPVHHLGASAGPLKSAAAEAAVKAAAEIASASVISGKANRDTWYAAMAESVPGMTDVLQAIDAYEVAHSPDRERLPSSALERRQHQQSLHDVNKLDKKDHGKGKGTGAGAAAVSAAPMPDPNRTTSANANNTHAALDGGGGSPQSSSANDALTSSKGSKSASSLARHDSQKDIELRFQLLQGVHNQLNDLAAANVLRGVPSDNLVYYPSFRKGMLPRAPFVLVRPCFNKPATRSIDLFLLLGHVVSGPRPG